MYVVCSLAIQPTPSCMPFLPLWMHSRHACCSWPSGPVNSVYPACAKQGDRIQTILLKITSAWLEKVRVPDHGPPEKKDLIFSSCSDSTEERGHPRATAFVHIGRWTHSPFLVEKGHGKTKVCFFGGCILCFEKEWHHKALRFNCKDSTWRLLCFFDRGVTLGCVVDIVIWCAKKQKARKGVSQPVPKAQPILLWSDPLGIWQVNADGLWMAQGIVWKMGTISILLWTEGPPHAMAHRIASCPHPSRRWPSRADWRVRPRRTMDKRKISGLFCDRIGGSGLFALDGQ